MAAPLRANPSGVSMAALRWALVRPPDAGGPGALPGSSGGAPPRSDSRDKRCPVVPW